MKINLDDEIRRTHIRAPENKSTISPAQLLFIIFLGVFMANMFSWGSQRGIDYLIAKEILKQATQELEKMTAQNKLRVEEQRKINEKQTRQRQLENQKKQAGYRQAMETCDFWKQQYQKQRTSSNKYQRDQACNLVNKFR